MERADQGAGLAMRRCPVAGKAILSIYFAMFGARIAEAQVAPAPPPSADSTALADEAAKNDIFNLDIQQLSETSVHSASTAMSTEVTTAARTAEPISRTPAAIYVVTNEMIRRSGARCVPEVLRLVPGVEVARMNASTWAITIRGGNARFADKLLVQIDGVAIYSPTHSGVFWEREYVMLEDVDRIEVIRGPGAAVWGVNAVNGIINIITKSSKDTHGAYIDGGVGSDHDHRQFSDARFGGQSGDLHWRVYGMNAQGRQRICSVAA